MLIFSPMQDSPLFSIIFFAASLYLFKMWYDDAIYAKINKIQRKGSFAGAYFPKKAALFIACCGAIILLALQCCGEYALDMVKDQSNVKYFALFSWLGAAFIEELVFRGYLVVQNKGKTFLWISIFAFSFLFALLHPFLWDCKMPDNFADISLNCFTFDFSAKAFFSTSFIFLNSLFFYWARFNKLNKNCSLLPAVAAHFTYNIGVFIVKLFQGFIEF